jgi:predicted acyltransferase
VVKRAAIIFALGLLLNGFPRYNLSTLRIPGVLQRIGVCYLIAAAIFLYSRMRTQIVWVVGLLAAYWVLMKAVPVPGYGAGVLEPVGSLAWYIDSLVLKGHMWAHTGGVWDPEGIVSTIPSVATVLFGILCGHLLRTERSHTERAVWMFVTGNALMFVGLMLSTWMPINKMIWTTSYAVFVAGLDFNGFAICYWVVEGLERKRWAQALIVFGMNAIAAYVISEGIDHLLSLSGVGKWLMANVFSPIANPYNAALLYAVMNVLMVFAAVAFMYRRKWFVRI